MYNKTGMYTLIKPEDFSNEVLEVSRTIFLRPTPWKIAWIAGFAYVLRRNTFRFVFLPKEFHEAKHDVFELHEGRLVVKCRNKEVFYSPTFPLSFHRWVIYGVESWVYGLFTSFWNWRWDAGSLTKQELQARLERLERKLEERTRRIVEDDEDDSE